MISHPKRDLALINAAGLLRSFGVGLMGVVLGIYLFRTGLSPTAIGLIIAMGLAGSASATVLMTIAADRMGRRWFLVILSLLSAVGGIALALSPSLPVLAVMAFIGMLNGTGTDRSASFALDQAIVPGLVPDARRTWGLAWYNVLLDGGGSLGALGAGLPLLLQHQMSVTILRSYRLVFFGYSALCVVVAAIYLCLSPAIEVGSPGNIASIRTRQPSAKRHGGTPSRWMRQIKESAKMNPSENARQNVYQSLLKTASKRLEQAIPGSDGAFAQLSLAALLNLLFLLRGEWGSIGDFVTTQRAIRAVVGDELLWAEPKDSTPSAAIELVQ